MHGVQRVLERAGAQAGAEAIEIGGEVIPSAYYNSKKEAALELEVRAGFVLLMAFLLL